MKVLLLLCLACVVGARPRRPTKQGSGPVTAKELNAARRIFANSIAHIVAELNRMQIELPRELEKVETVRKATSVLGRYGKLYRKGIKPAVEWLERTRNVFGRLASNGFASDVEYGCSSIAKELSNDGEPISVEEVRGAVSRTLDCIFKRWQTLRYKLSQLKDVEPNAARSLEQAQLLARTILESRPLQTKLERFLMAKPNLKQAIKEGRWRQPTRSPDVTETIPELTTEGSGSEDY